MNSYGIEKIKSDSAHMGYRYICPECHGEVEIGNKHCRWCGVGLISWNLQDREESKDE